MIEKIGIIGAGAMGSSIAEVFAYNGYTVYLKDQNLDYVNKGINHARKVLEDFQAYANSLPEKVVLYLLPFKHSLYDNSALCKVII